MPRWLLQCACAALAVSPVFAAEERAARVGVASGQALREWGDRVDGLTSSGELVVRLTRDDTMIPGRRHERLAQLHRGVPVFGGELARQSDAVGHPHRLRHPLRGHRRRRDAPAAPRRGGGAPRRPGRASLRAAWWSRAGRPAPRGRRLSPGLASASLLRGEPRRASGVPRRRRPGTSSSSTATSRSRWRRSAPASSATRRSSAWRRPAPASRRATGCGRPRSPPTTSGST